MNESCKEVNNEKLQPLSLLACCSTACSNVCLWIICRLNEGVTHSGDESGVRLDMSSWVGTADIQVKGHRVKMCLRVSRVETVLAETLQSFHRYTVNINEIIWAQFVWRDFTANQIGCRETL